MKTKVFVFEFNLYITSAKDITKKVNEFCEEYDVIDIKVTKAHIGVKDMDDSLFYTIIYKE